VARKTSASVPDRLSTAPAADTAEKTQPGEPPTPPETQPAAAPAANAPAANAPAANASAAAPLNPPPQPTVQVAEAPPLNVVPPENNSTLKAVLPPITASPVIPSVQSSTGVSGGTVERQVKPIYPPEALRLKREGQVRLQAVITKEGGVRNLKVLAGDSLLARAAMDAVAGWRYKPFVLNGQPIQRTTEITIVFKLP